MAFDGEGARRYGGRWNPRGTVLVYTSATLSLAAMELLVHLDEEDLARAYVAVPADIPDTVAIGQTRIADLPRGWRSYPAPPALAERGRRFVQTGATAVLAVPSAIIPHELNHLLNPRHPHFERIHVGRPEPFVFDPRLGPNVGRSSARRTRP